MATLLTISRLGLNRNSLVHKTNFQACSSNNEVQALAIQASIDKNELLDHENGVETDPEDDLSVHRCEALGVFQAQHGSQLICSRTRDLRELAVTDDYTIEQNLNAFLRLEDKKAFSKISRTTMFG